MAMYPDGNYDFMSALMLSSSKIDLTLPFEDEFQNRLSIHAHDRRQSCGSGFEDTSALPDHMQDVAMTELPLSEQTLSSATAPSDAAPTRRHCGGPTPSESWDEATVCGDDELDEYHRGLLQVTGTDDRFFRPSYRRQSSDDMKQQRQQPEQQRSEQQQQQQQQMQQQQQQHRYHHQRQQQQQHQQLEQQQKQQHDPNRHKRPALHVCTTRLNRPRPRAGNVALPINRHIPESAFKSESFWIDGDGGVTPRVTLTRYDLRADEKDIYAWKGDVANGRNAIYAAPRMT